MAKRKITGVLCRDRDDSGQTVAFAVGLSRHEVRVGPRLWYAFTPTFRKWKSWTPTAFRAAYPGVRIPKRGTCRECKLEL